MTATPPPAAGTIRPLIAAWHRFLFEPKAPTPLCLMRIVAGLLTIYVHLAYTTDLVAFFGPHAWYEQALANRVRTEFPHTTPTVDSWDDPPFIYAMPHDHTLRKHVSRFLRELGRTPRSEPAVLRLFDLLAKMPDEDRREVLRYVRGLPYDPEAREAEYAHLRASVPDAPPPPPPGPFKPLEVPPPVPPVPPVNVIGGAHLPLPGIVERWSAEERAQLTKDMESLYNALPADGRANYLLVDYLQGMNNFEWNGFTRFATELGPDVAVRDTRLDYLQFWNLEQKYTIGVGQRVYSPWFHITDERLMLPLHALHLLVFVLFTVGLWTRVTSVLAWLCAVGYIHRAQAVLFGQDTMMNMSLLYLMIAPCGATWSADRLIARYRAAKQGRPVLPGAEVEPSVFAGFALRLFQINYALMYFSAGLAKLKGEAWWNHHALWYCLANPEFAPMPLPAYRTALVWLCRHRGVWEVSMTLSVAFTMSIELGFPYLVWGKLRYVMVAGAILLHTGIAMLMGLNVFSLFMFTLLLCWIPPAAIRKFFVGERPALPGYRLRYDQADAPAAKAAAALHALDVWDQVELVPEAGAGFALTHDGRPATAAEAAATLPLAGWLPGAAKVVGGLAPTPTREPAVARS